MKLLLLFFIIFHLTGCYTMHFIRGSQTSSVRYTHSNWHHIGVLGFVEFSEPVNLNSVCNEVDRWRAVKVETGLLMSLVRAIPIPIPTRGIEIRQLKIPNILIPFPLTLVYSPEQVSVACLPHR